MGLIEILAIAGFVLVAGIFVAVLGAATSETHFEPTGLHPEQKQDFLDATRDPTHCQRTGETDE